AAKVRVVPFNVEFDADRQVWFSDIEMTDVSSFFPFVRFAFARYQPFSVTDAHLSPVVRADFVQLVNDRTATIMAKKGSTKGGKPDGKGDTIHVTVTGISAHNRLGADIVSAMLATAPSP